jgi:hypothetical protein
MKDQRIAFPRGEYSPVTRALYDAAEVLPEGSKERKALMYLAQNTGAFVILDMGDKVINNGLRMAIEKL